ncbi:MAG: SCO4402 family protein [Fimbriimonas sp.]
MKVPDDPPDRKLRLAELTMPHGYWRIRECVDAFASPEKRAKWRGPARDYDTLFETWNALGDQGVFRGDCQSLIGVSLRDRTEAKAVRELAEALRRAGDALEDKGEPAQYLDHPAWEGVITAAQRAQRLLKRGDY